MTTTVNISPGVSVLSLFRHLNYRPWYAMAEFVDNSLQSFLDYRESLSTVECKRLVVKIELDQSDTGQITIRDNAAGIHEADYQRAFKTAQPPADSSGLCEFGVGMKSAACWFARKWSVRTSALGERVERLIEFDIDSIVRQCLEELTPVVSSAREEDHYTEIVLRGLHNPLQTRTISKIREHLASIYRVFNRDGLLELWFNKEQLEYDEPAMLTAKYYKDEAGEPKLWRKDIDLDFGLGLRARGFAALRQKASTSQAGFALFRRNRLVQGSADEAYRPSRIFKHSNSYTYQRLFGELHLDGFEVTHTKDGFRWEDHEEAFLELLEEELNAPPLPLLDQAEGHRVRPKAGELKQGAEVALEATARAIQTEVPPVLERQLSEKPDDLSPPPTLPTVDETSKRVIEADLNGVRWRIVLELTSDPSIGEWLSVSDQPSLEDVGGVRVRRVGARLSLAHPFMDRFGGTEPDRIEPLLRVAAALALAETAARDSGVKQTGTIRRNINELLRSALSKP